MRVLLRRDGALGDVIHTIPIVKRLRQELGPDATIHVATSYPHLYQGNTDCTRVFPPSDIGTGYDRKIDLNMSFEKKRGKIHIIEAYMEAVFGDADGDKEYWLEQGHAYVRPPSTPYTKTIGIHPSTSWSCRTFPKAWWQKVVDEITARGYYVIALGTGRDHTLERCTDTRDRMNVHDQLATIEACASFVCSESGLMIVAGASSTPVVSIFNITRAEYVMPWRRGVLGHGYTVVKPDIDCYGCAEKHQDVTWMGCSRHDEICLTMVDPAQIAEHAVVAAQGGHI